MVLGEDSAISQFKWIRRGGDQDRLHKLVHSVLEWWFDAMISVFLGSRWNAFDTSRPYDERSEITESCESDKHSHSLK